MRMNPTSSRIPTLKFQHLDSLFHKQIERHNKEESIVVNDVLAVEEPLEIRIKYHTQHGIYRMINLAVTMRTPGDDEALARGFLFTEGIVKSMSDIVAVDKIEANIIALTLSPTTEFDSDKMKRNFYTTSSCGVCGKASIESIHSDTIYLPWSSKFVIDKRKLFSLSEKLKTSQASFEQTGGIHACALFDADGELVAVKEDVGRHNAMDKLLGIQSNFPLEKTLVLVSGRASFELVQKASKAGIPMMVAIGAPSSLAVQLAEEQGMTLIGFLKNSGFNVYSREDRIVEVE